MTGPSALLIAKLHKISDRRGMLSRQDDKDALDVYRLLRAMSLDLLQAGMGSLLADALSKNSAREAIEILDVLFKTEAAEGTQMVVRAVQGLEDPAITAASCAALASELIAAISR